MLWSSVVVAVSFGAGFLWVHFGLRSILEARNDAFLERKGAELSAALSDARSGGPQALEAEIRREVAAYEREGLVVVVRRPGAVAAFPSNDRSEALARQLNQVSLNLTARTIRLGSNGSYRVARIHLPSATPARYTIDLGLSLAETEGTLAQFDARVAAGSLVFLGLAIAGGLFLSRQALRPVAQSIRTAQRLNPQNLSARLPRTGAEDELDQLAGTINELLDRLAAYHAQVIRFTADASHELRSPLGAMRAAVEVALQQPRSMDEYRDTLASLGEQCDRLTTLVNGLLLLARADVGEVEVKQEPVDLALLVAEVAEMYQPLAEERGLSLAWSQLTPVLMRGDSQRLRQLVVNLLDNAIKFTERGGRVTLRVEKTGDRAIVVVTDTGMGIPAEALVHVFDRFYQSDPARSSGGAGLGLSICRWVAEAHGGSIRARSDPGQGSTFTVTLPIPSADSTGDLGKKVDAR
jgi:heavy metal sensor kinase